MLFTAALQLANPWKVIDVSFRDAAGGKRELRITVGYGPGSRFHCPEAKCREESTRSCRAWPARPMASGRFRCRGRDRAVASALLFEAMVVELAKTQPVADVAAQVGEHDTRL